MLTLASLLPRLHQVTQTRQGYLARCPAHQDASPSLSIRQAPGGKLLLYCWAGCDYRAILEALGEEPGAPRPAPAPLTWEQDARLKADALLARYQARHLLWETRYLYRLADTARRLAHRIQRLQERATTLGPDSDVAWEMTEHASRLERQNFLIALALDRWWQHGCTTHPSPSPAQPESH